MTNQNKKLQSDDILAATVSSWGQALRLYSDRRLWRIFGLGMSSGFPWVMIGSSLSAWLAEEGLSRTNIGFFGFIFVAYSINFLWSPLIDRLRIPVLGAFFGQRRSWIILTQCLIAVCCWMIAAISPAQDISYAKTVAFALALFSATQDISIDAYRIDSIPKENARLMAAGSAMATSGWWTGFAGLGAIPLLLVDFDAWSWSDVYILMALIVLVLGLVPLFSPEPQTDREALQAQSGEKYRNLMADSSEQKMLWLSGAMIFNLLVIAWLIVGLPGVSDVNNTSVTLLLSLLVLVLSAYIVSALLAFERQAQLGGLMRSGTIQPRDPKAMHQLLTWMIVSFIEPLVEFFRRNGIQLALSVLLFIFLFKIGEAFLGRMSIVFYKEIGFSNTDIALYSKLVSWWVTILFSLLGSLVTIRYGILRGLFVGGLAMSASNLMFALIATVGPSKGLLVAAVVVDGFTSAWSTVAFVAFLSMMCSRAFTASQYALMASLGTLGRTFLASYSGLVVDKLDGNWAVFFIITTLMVIPSLLLLYRIRHRLRALAKEF